jgi:hypothetical protein
VPSGLVQSGFLALFSNNQDRTGLFSSSIN